MSDLGPFQDPAVREWFESLPNPDYWDNCAELRRRGRETARAEHTSQQQG